MLKLSKNRVARLLTNPKFYCRDRPSKMSRRLDHSHYTPRHPTEPSINTTRKRIHNNSNNSHHPELQHIGGRNARSSPAPSRGHYYEGRLPQFPRKVVSIGATAFGPIAGAVRSQEGHLQPRESNPREPLQCARFVSQFLTVVGQNRVAQTISCHELADGDGTCIAKKTFR